MRRPENDLAPGFPLQTVEIEDEARWQAIAQTEICRRWWPFMREIMPADPDDSPVSTELREVFHIEAPDARKA